MHERIITSTAMAASSASVTTKYKYMQQVIVSDCHSTTLCNKVVCKTNPLACKIHWNIELHVRIFSTSSRPAGILRNHNSFLMLQKSLCCGQNRRKSLGINQCSSLCDINDKLFCVSILLLFYHLKLTLIHSLSPTHIHHSIISRSIYKSWNSMSNSIRWLPWT